MAGRVYPLLIVTKAKFHRFPAYLDLIYEPVQIDAPQSKL
jgi:hypothetical protein